VNNRSKIQINHSEYGHGNLKKSQKQEGFTYITVLIMVIIMGIMLGAIGTSWRTILKREREEELLFRGQQIRDAIARWYKPRGGQQVATPLRDLKDLLHDPRTPATVRYLRRLYTDPMTNDDWEIINDPQRGIVGVASKSQEEPLKIDGFPDELQTFVGKKHYSEWKFVYGSQVQGQNTSSKVRGPQ
jgi:type II secretory pathway pseudopilin PulG